MKAHFAHEVALSVLSENLKYASDLCAEAGIKVLIGPLNTIDMPGYLIGQTIQARTVMAIVNSEKFVFAIRPISLWHER